MSRTTTTIMKDMALHYDAAMLGENVLNSSLEVAKDLDIPPDVFLRTLALMIGGMPDEMWKRMEETGEAPVIQIIVKEEADQQFPTAGEA